MKICANCGHENEDNAKFCASCGNNVKTLEPSDTHVDFEPDDNADQEPVYSSNIESQPNNEQFDNGQQFNNQQQYNAQQQYNNQPINYQQTYQNRPQKTCG